MTGFEMSYTREYLDQLGWADERAKLQDRIEELEKNLSYEVEQKIKLADTLRDERAKRPDREQERARVITLCGSSWFKDEFHAENQRLTMEGNVVISLGIFGHVDMPDYDWTTDATDLKRTLDRLHFQKIDMADEVHVVAPGGYVGESTAREIAYAQSLGKVVSYSDPAVLALEPEAREVTDAEVEAAYSAFVQTSFGFPGAPAMRAALESSRGVSGA